MSQKYGIYIYLTYHSQVENNHSQVLKESTKANPSTLEIMAGNKIQLKTGNELIFIAQDEIVAVMAENIYCVFLLKENKKVKTALSLSAAMQLLETQNFYKIHRSYIININAIERIDLATATVQLQHCAVVFQIARQQKKAFLAFLKNN